MNETSIIEFLIKIYRKLRIKKTFWTIAVPILFFLLGELTKLSEPFVKWIELLSANSENIVIKALLEILGTYLKIAVPNWVTVLVLLLFIMIWFIRYLELRKPEGIDPVIAIYPDAVFVKNKIDHILNIDWKINITGAGVSNLDITLFMMTKDGNEINHFYTRTPFPKDIKIQKNHTWISSIGSYDVRDNSKLYLYLKGSYSNIIGNKSYSISDVYEYNPRTKKTMLPPDNVSNIFKSHIEKTIE